MTQDLPPVTITGIGSVSPYGPLAGLIPKAPLEPAQITAWTTGGERRAFLVPSFRPAAVVPGVKTRRLDRLSAWALVASSLAIKDAGIDLAQLDRSRVAVVFATAFGCIELTESFYLSAAANGWNGTDPITFPETLASAPASHVSMFHGLRGPNITVSNKYFAGECAILQAASVIRQGQADVAIMLAGDALAGSLYAWYEQAGLLSAACYNSNAMKDEGFIPSEGVAALVMESSARVEGRHNGPTYARVGSGRWAAGGNSAEVVRQMLNDSGPTLAICSGDGEPCAASSTASLVREVAGDDCVIMPPEAMARGLAGNGALFHLIVALGNLANAQRLHRQAIFLGTARDNGFAAILLELP
ncbi:MAG TPA: beta-ketoacyl synthase N-terminal-like domain-containing protein [Candidatus Sulfotelmatobacter sp.]|nr:beta-ketoacyl synthase N-terminal-like domain-containing protein [Candidatus Sulfotelmatobacter sp.]